MKNSIPVRTEYERTGEDGTPMWVEILKDDDYDKTTQNQRQLNFRCYHELVRTVQNKGNVHIFTLTYRDEELPSIIQNIYWKKENEKEFEIEQREITTAWKEDIQHFNYRLRNKLRERGNQYKYIITHEYGKEDWYLDERGKWREATARPHYHCIYFVIPSIDRNELQKIIFETWGKGRTRDDIIENNIIAGINYTTKYTTKDTKMKDKRFSPKKEGYEIVDIFYSENPIIYKTNKRSEFDEKKEKYALKEDKFMPRLMISTNVGTGYITGSDKWDDSTEEPMAERFLQKEYLLPTTVVEREVKTIRTNLPRYYFNKYCKKSIKDKSGKQKTRSLETEFYVSIKDRLKKKTTEEQYKQFIKDIHKYLEEEEKQAILKIDTEKTKYFLRHRKCNFTKIKGEKINISQIDSEFTELWETYDRCYIENEKSRVNRMKARKQRNIEKRREKKQRKMQGNIWRIAKNA